MAVPGKSIASPARASRVAELAGEVRAAPPPPPVPQRVQPRAPAVPNELDRRVQEFAKRSGALPPPEEGFTRLYRAGKLPTDSPPRSRKDLITDPWGNVMTRAQWDAQKGAGHANPLDAEGRWFTDAANELDFYVKENDIDPVYYLDMPSAHAQEANVRNTPFISSSRNPDREFVVPPLDVLGARRLLDGLR